MKRYIYQYLEEWKNSTNRKVLLLRGARQIGKTYIVRELGKQFEFHIEINFEKNTDVCLFFDQNLDPGRIAKNLAAYYETPIIQGKTLLFFDEIQACPNAIKALRFFYEEMPDLHVLATGSLLEFAIQELPSWGVGRIRSLFMYPMSFDEFLLAGNHKNLIDLKKEASPDQPLNPALHNKLIDLLKVFMTIGGMPEVVETHFINPTNFASVQKVLSDITISYFDDFVKYKKRAPVLRLQEVLNSVILQTGGKFNYSKAGNLSNNVQAKEAFELLQKAGLVHKIYHSSAQGIPLGAGKNFKKFKSILLDSGIFQQNQSLQISDYLTSQNIDTLNKGAIAELFAGLELIKYFDPYQPAQLYYWHREKRGSTAEVDYLIERNNNIFPLEIKSGRQGKMQSLHLFLREQLASKGIRISLENFSKFDQIEVLPLYAISNLFQNNSVPR